MISVQVLIIDAIITGSRSLKEKRAVLNSIKGAISSKFNVSISELGYANKWQRTLLGFAVISSDGKLNSKILEKISDIIHNDGRLEVVNSSIEELG
ncbi:conserved hypothetical protein [Thermotomaculum hydrothermale]|uniref:DUF503 domain-containing protein n=1 Tax=Thermotomaculum hydrothermale TaxID=981385 RepID=A0A7R6PQQ8_9BACT|nr:DUF503 domain-containing protein [Thermotomaculum hydrothermale]BBB33591.1 conserved hypothetical protein [Thermotomaculum hydrothermale]